jgi:hypothetical protein
MNIVWQTRSGPETDFEYEYVRHVILKNIEAPETFDQSNYSQSADGSIVIYSSNDKNISADLRDYLSRHHDYTLIHLSLERLLHRADYYHQARLVLRPYFDPRLSCDHLYYVPIGFQTGFLRPSHLNIKFEDKKYIWCFAGQLKSHRKRMIRELTALQPHFIHITQKWADPNALTPDDMRKIYQHTLFVPCPFGNRNPDSYRIMEALEYGCIPVVLTFLGEDYFKYVFGDHPFIVAQSWAQAREKMADLCADQARLRDYYNKSCNWYQKFKSDLAEDVRKLIENHVSYDALISTQFKYQRAPNSSWRLRLYDLYYGHGLHRRIFRWFVNL